MLIGSPQILEHLSSESHAFSLKNNIKATHSYINVILTLWNVVHYNGTVLDSRLMNIYFYMFFISKPLAPSNYLAPSKLDT